MDITTYAGSVDGVVNYSLKDTSKRTNESKSTAQVPNDSSEMSTSQQENQSARNSLGLMGSAANLGDFIAPGSLFNASPAAEYTNTESFSPSSYLPLQ
ncbi:hypothetical protein [Mesorhizobium sp. M0040]|uniref:hypothetical protein n=1 Tax=Mesorhizobium sp. M0040 TaxID=2956855 RepID=UPI00333B47D3